MKFARVAGLFVVVALGVAPPAMAATVAVAPLRDGGAKRGMLDYVRHQIEAGLTNSGAVVVGAPALAAAAQKQGLSPDDLGKPAVLMPVAKAAGADAVLTGTLDSGALQIRVFSLESVELWSRSIKLVKGRLAPDIPGKIARAVSAAISTAPSSDGANASAAGNAALDAAGGTDSGEGTDGADASAAAGDTGTTSNDTTQAGDTGSSAANTNGDETAIVTPKHPASDSSASDSSTSSSSSTSEGEVAIEGPPKETRADTTPAPPIIDVGVGFALLTRSYKLCPGVQSCSDAPVAAQGTKDVPISYQTSSPSSGILLHAELFPVPHLWQISEDLTFTLGVEAEYILGFAVSNAFQDPDTGVPGKFASKMSRLSAGATARLYFHLLDGTGYAGLYGGALLPSFSVDSNPVLAPSTRKGFDVGVHAEIPLAADYVKLTVQGALAPAANPGIEETTDYGQTGKGSGWLFRGGFEGDYKFLGYGAYVDIAHFGDSFTGGGDLTTNGAVSDESYMTYFVMLRGRY